MKIQRDKSKPLKLNPDLSSEIEANLEAERADREERRQARDQQRRQRRRRTWMLFVLISFVYTFVLPVTAILLFDENDPRSANQIFAISLLIIYPIGEFWRRRFKITYGQMAAAMGGGGFVAASLNIIYAWIQGG